MGESAKEALVFRTQKIMREQKMAEEGTGILAAVSGGADSLCLLDLLDALRKTAHFPLRAVHVHHGIRKSADRDAALAEAFCRKRDIPCSILRVDVPAARAAERTAEKKIAGGVEDENRKTGNPQFWKNAEPHTGIFRWDSAHQRGK